MIRTKNRLIRVGWLAGLMLLGAAGAAGAQEAMQLAAAAKLSDKEQLSFYFSDENLVEVTTRAPKPLPRVAENVTIISAEQIEEMNAHHVNDVIKHVSGLFTEGNGQDFGSSAPASSIHGSDYEHVLVLIDGIRFNDINGWAETNNIPIGIIKRIEIIKGPASSTWGSAFGGVINIITKDTGKTSMPSGRVFSSYGEAHTSDISADAAGKAGGPVSYYLYAQNQNSRGLKNDRFYDTENYFGKLKLDLPGRSAVTLSAGTMNPHYKSFDLPDWDLSVQTRYRRNIYSGSLDIPIATGLNMYGLFYYQTINLGSYYQTISTDTLSYESVYETKKTGGSTRLVWNERDNAAVFGADFERSSQDTYDHDASTQFVNDSVRDETWGLYFNDTYNWSKLTVTPGIRYDHDAIAESMVSPSLGLIYRATDQTLLRFTTGKGFRKAPASLTRGNTYLYGNNPNLGHEKIISYQAGIETLFWEALRVKTTYFYHDAKESWYYDALNAAAWANDGKKNRQGIELEVETSSWKGLSAKANYTYVYERSESRPTNQYTDQDFIFNNNDYLYTANLIITYDEPRIVRAVLSGNYVWYNDRIVYSTSNVDDSKYGTWLWDLRVNRAVYAKDLFGADLFCNVHNLFNGSSYWTAYYPNPGRWAEAGVTIRY